MKIYTPIAILLLLASCTTPASHPSAPVPADSTKAQAHSTVDTGGGGVRKMLGFFKTGDSGVIDRTVEIDKAYIEQIFNDTDRLWDHISAINPEAVSQNRSGTFFIVKFNCASGGYCAEFYLIGFAGNHPVPPRKLGAHYADADFEQTFDYRMRGDSAVDVTTINYDESGKVKDSADVRFPLRIQKDSLAAPSP